MRSRFCVPSTPQPNFQTTTFNIAASVVDESLLVIVALRTSFNYANNVGLNQKPPKQLLASRLAVTTSTDEVLDYIKSKVGTLSPLSCVKLTKYSNSDRVIAPFKVTNSFECDTIWSERLFIKP